MRPRRRLAVLILTILALSVSIISPVAADEPPGPVPVGTDALARGSWIVTLVAGADAAIAAADMATAAGGRAGLTYSHALHGFQFLGSAQAAAALERNPRVASVEPDAPLFLTETLPYGVERVAAYGLGGVVGAYQAGYRGNGARIAILDTGIDLDHPDLAASIDGTLGRNCLNAAAAPNDGYGHGTHVAGTAAAPINGVGVAGVAPQARLVAVKMFDDAGNSSEALALCALDHVIGLNADADPANNVHVANMSWGEQRTWGDCASDSLHGAICAAHDAGIILVAGAGNSAVNAGSFVPAAYPEVLSVSALADFDGERGGLAGCGLVVELFAQECDDSFAFFSNFGSSVDVIAPGVQVYSTWAGGGWRTSSGTSMATPHIAGIAALMAAAAPGLTPDAARAALLTSGECPNGQAADADGVSGCGGQGTWRDDPDGTPEPMGHALRAAQAAASAEPAEPPSAPNLSAAATGTSIDLSWTAPADDGGAAITGYEIYRGASPGTATLYATLGSGSSYSDSGVAVGETWWYEVAAVNSAGTGARSNEVSATVPEPWPPEPPSAPTLSALASPTSIDLSWTAPADDGGAAISGYEIFRGPSSGSATLYATVGPVLAYADTDVAANETWYYEVTAVNSAGTGPRSNEVSATVPEPPDPPSAPTLSASAGDKSVTLGWTAPADDGGATVTGYQIFRGTSQGAATLVTTVGNVLSFKDTGRTNGTTYWYQVAAVNSAGPGVRSNEVSATPTAPATAPSAPRSLKAQKVTGGIKLTWVAPSSNGGSPLTEYRVYRTGGPSAVVFRVPASQLTFTDDTVASRTWYAYVVSALNAVGESQASNIVYLKSQ